MDRETLKRLAGLVDDEPHQIAEMLENGYTETEVAAALAYWSLQVQRGRQSREAMVADWLRLVPSRTEADLIRLARARWDDGMTGGQTARILGRAPE